MKVYKVSQRDATWEHLGYRFFSSRKEAEAHGDKALGNGHEVEITVIDVAEKATT